VVKVAGETACVTNVIHKCCDRSPGEGSGEKCVAIVIRTAQGKEEVPFVERARVDAVALCDSLQAVISSSSTAAAR